MMDKEELIEFLRENLSVNLKINYRTYAYNGYGLEVQLKLGDDVISSDTLKFNSDGVLDV